MEKLDHKLNKVNEGVQITAQDVIQNLDDEWLFSPHLYNNVIYDCFTEDGPIRLNRLEDYEYDQIPIFRQVKHLCKIIEEAKWLKLTATGNLPVKVVLELFPLGVLDWYYKKYPNKIKKENDAEAVQLTKILLELSGITKKKGNALSLTKRGEKLIKDNHELLKAILTTYSYKFNWSYFDGYGDNNLGQFGFGFTLIALAKYGSEFREDAFYSTISFTLLSLFRYAQDLSRPQRAYSVRLFSRFMQNFGLVELDEKSNFLLGENDSVRRTELFDKLIKIDNNFGKITISAQTNTPIYRLFIKLAQVLDGKEIVSFPTIWREFLVPSDILLRDLHVVIQTIMGWTNSHLHQFSKDNISYAEKYEGDNFFDELGSTDYKCIRLNDLLKNVGDTLEYEYDLGDGWTHTVELLGTLKYDGKFNFLTCLGGQHRCPPEDCGSFSGYKDILDTLEKIDNKLTINSEELDNEIEDEIEEEALLTWLGPDFDPTAFDLAKINKALSNLSLISWPSPSYT